MEEVEENPVEEMVEVSEPEMPVMPLFGKWDLTEVNIVDTTLEKYINLDAFQVPVQIPFGTKLGYHNLTATFAGNDYYIYNSTESRIFIKGETMILIVADAFCSFFQARILSCFLCPET